MIKLILADGCSAISGVEQADYCEWKDDPRGKNIEYSEHTWPALLWKEKYPTAIYYPTAKSGSSNMGIARRINFYVNKFIKEGYLPNEMLVCIQWSNLDRIEFSRSETHQSKNTSEFNYEDLNPVYIYGPAPNNRNWLIYNNFQKIIKPLYKHHYLLNDTLYYSYKEIEATNNLLNLYNIKNYQSAAFESLFYNPVKTNDFLNDLIERNQKLIHREYNKGNKKHKLGFFEYCWKYLDKEHVGPGSHPLLAGHQLWYTKIKQWYNIE